MVLGVRCTPLIIEKLVFRVKGKVKREKKFVLKEIIEREREIFVWVF